MLSAAGRVRWAAASEGPSPPQGESGRGREVMAHCRVVGAAGSESVFVGRIDAGGQDCSDFFCGVGELDGWVRGEAVAADRRQGSRVLVAAVGGRVIGCVQLSALQVEASSDEPAGVGEGAMPTPIGAVLISRLAVDRAWQRRGWGRCWGCRPW